MTDQVLIQNFGGLRCLGLCGRICAFVELRVKNTWREQEWCFSERPSDYMRTLEVPRIKKVTSFLPSFLPSVLPSFLPSLPPSFLPSFLSFFPSFLPSFLSSLPPSFLPSFLLSFLTSDTFTFTKHERQQSRTLVALVRVLQIRTTSLVLVEKNRVVEVFRTK